MFYPVDGPRNIGARTYSLLHSNCQNLVIELCTVLGVRFDERAFAKLYSAAATPKILVVIALCFSTIAVFSHFTPPAPVTSLDDILQSIFVFCYVSLISVLTVWEQKQVENRAARVPGHVHASLNVMAALSRLHPLSQLSCNLWGYVGRANFISMTQLFLMPMLWHNNAAKSKLTLSTSLCTSAALLVTTIGAAWLWLGNTAEERHETVMSYRIVSATHGPSGWQYQIQGPDGLAITSREGELRPKH